MAAKKKPKKPIPKSAAQKGAEAALQGAQKVALEAQRQRTGAASKGAFRARQLRAGGTSLQQYDLARFKSDPFPGLGGGQSGLGATPPGGSSASARASGPKSTAKSTDGKNRIKQQAKAKAENRLKTNPSGVNNAEKMEAQAAAKAKAAAAAKAKAEAAAKKKKQKLTDSKGGVTKAIGTKPVAS